MKTRSAGNAGEVIGSGVAGNAITKHKASRVMRAERINILYSPIKKPVFKQKFKLKYDQDAHFFEKSAKSAQRRPLPPDPRRLI